MRDTAGTTEQYAIHARGLRKAFGGLTAVDGVDLAVRAGEIFGLVGPDGAGKTTIMRLLVGILGPDAGAMEVAGCDVRRDPETVKQRIGYVSQRFSLYGDLTVAENLYFFARVHHVGRAERIARERQLLEFSRLGPFRDRLAANLSGGMKQKLALACTLMHTPSVLFLDEPTTGVDPVSRRDFWKILYQLVQDGMTLFVSTPYMDEAERCNRVALIDRGRITVCDTPDGLKRRMRGELLELIATPLPVARETVAALHGVLGVQVFGERLHLWVEDAAAGEAAVRQALPARGVAIASVRPAAPGLEDVFISLTTEEAGDGG